MTPSDKSLKDLPPLRIALSHPDWLVVEKPANVLVHPTKPDGTPTLWHQLQEAFPGEALALINRLDRETSGLVLASRHSGAASTLGKMTMRREIEKEYLVLCQGRPSDSGTIDAPLDRIGKRAKSVIYLKQGIHPEGYPARTHYLRLETRTNEQSLPISLLRVRLETGRLHQIRVHLSSIGHSVIGDKIYGSDDNCYLRFIETGWTEELAQILWLPHHALHAEALRFQWKEMAVNCVSVMPEDLRAFWEKLSPERAASENK